MQNEKKTLLIVNGLLQTRWEIRENKIFFLNKLRSRLKSFTNGNGVFRSCQKHACPSEKNFHFTTGIEERTRVIQNGCREFTSVQSFFFFDLK